MRRPIYPTVCLLGALALAAGGCGESSPKTGTSTVASASTDTTVQTTTPSSNGGPTAPSGGATDPGGGSTGPSGGSTGPSGGHASKQTSAEAAKAAEARAEARVLRTKLAAERRIAQIRARYRSQGVAEKKAQLEATKRAALKKRKPYPEYVRAKFTAQCEAGKGSASQCACILSKQEFSSVEVGLSFAELLALERAFQQGKTIQELGRPHPPRHPVELPGHVQIHLEQCMGAK